MAGGIAMEPSHGDCFDCVGLSLESEELSLFLFGLFCFVFALCRLR